MPSAMESSSPAGLPADLSKPTPVGVIHTRSAEIVAFHHYEQQFLHTASDREKRDRWNRGRSFAEVKQDNDQG